MKKIIKNFLLLTKPRQVIIRPFNKWSDLGSWDNFDEIGKTLYFY